MDFIKILRHYVPKCPRCGSPYTGRFIIDNPGKQIEITQKYLNKGERVEVISGYTIPYHNCYCSECDMQWHQDIPIRFYGRKEWAKICEITGTEEEAIWFQKEKWQTNNEASSFRKQRRRKYFKTGIKFVAYFFLGIDIFHLPFQNNKKENSINEQSD